MATVSNIIKSSVGLGGRNQKTDAVVIQQLLSAVPATKGGPMPTLDPGGKCGPKTWSAIRQFQTKNVGGIADGGSAATIVAWTIVSQNEEGVDVVNLADDVLTTGARRVFLPSYAGTGVDADGGLVFVTSGDGASGGIGAFDALSLQPAQHGIDGPARQPRDLHDLEAVAVSLGERAHDEGGGLGQADGSHGCSSGDGVGIGVTLRSRRGWPTPYISLTTYYLLHI